MMELISHVKPCDYFENIKVNKYDSIGTFLVVKPIHREVDFHYHTCMDDFRIENPNDCILAANSMCIRPDNNVRWLRGQSSWRQMAN